MWFWKHCMQADGLDGQRLQTVVTFLAGDSGRPSDLYKKLQYW